MAAAGAAAQPQVLLHTSNVPGLLTMLQTLRTKDKQDCMVSVAPDGLSVRMEDDSKSLQAQVFLKAQLFEQFECRRGDGARSVSFGLPLALLLDTVAVFAPMPMAELSLTYPGPRGQELAFEMQDGLTCTYAQLGSVEGAAPGDLADYWQDPSSHFVVQGVLLKEAIEDLEWPGGPVVVALERDPRAVLLRSQGTGALEVSIPSEALASFAAHEPSVRHCYRYKHLAAAMTNIPAHRDPGQVSTKVTIDSSGLMRVQHMVQLAAGGGAHQQQQAHDHYPGGGTHPSMGGGFGSQYQQQQQQQGARTGVVTFHVLPTDMEDEGA